MKENISKPITVARVEFYDNLVNLTNNSMLPPYILEPILKDVYMEVKSMAQRQYESDKRAYEELLMQNAQGKEQEDEE